MEASLAFMLPLAQYGPTWSSKVTRKLKTVSQFVADNSFATAGQVRWWIFNERHNGMADHGVVVRLGRRVYIDVPAFDQWVDSQQAAAQASAA